MSGYEDIINASRPLSRREPMSLYDRAAQFSPFSALTAHGIAIAEANRFVDKRAPLSDEERDALNRVFRELRERIKSRPSVSLTFFIPDALKEGGVYETYTGRVRTIDEVQEALIFENGDSIGIDAICALEFTQ